MLFPTTLLAPLAYIGPLYVFASPSTISSSERLVQTGSVQRVLEHEPVRDTDCRHPPLGPIETTQCNYETIESVNDDLYHLLHEIVDSPFFKYYKVDLYRECPFWDDNDMCASRDCVIETVDESEIPEKWRAKALSKVEEPSLALKHSLPGCYYRDSDYCWNDEEDSGEYVDLSQNPERFTGYAGKAAQAIWRAIYEENCFGVKSKNVQAETYSPLALNPLLQLVPKEEQEPEGECLEKRVYYKIISGMHASISTHICYDYLDQKSGKWGPNLECFIERVANYPDRLQYIYFNNVLLLRAISRVGPYLASYDICSSTTNSIASAVAEDEALKFKLAEVISISDRVGKFDESVLFRGEQKALKEEFKEHFRNVSSIMDCVGCMRCRLWGKVQIRGLATAMKILFELDDAVLDPVKNPHLLQRAEVVALINTAHRFSESLYAVDEFRRLWAEAENREVILNKVEENIRNPPLIKTTPPSPSQAAAFPTAPSTGAPLYDRLQHLASVCKYSTWMCFRTIITFLQRVADAFRTVFRGSGKDGIPHEEF